jgi:ADP-dependent phosphofructokinase/glucokinase
MTQLTQQQLTKVKEQFCLNLVYDMDLDTLQEIVHEQLMQGYDDFDQEEIKEEVVSYYNEDNTEYDKIVNTVTNSPYTSYGDYVTTNPEVVTDYGVGK